MARVVLRAGHVKPVFTGHPWIFKQAILSIEGGPSPGDEVFVVDQRGVILGRGLYSGDSTLIPVRLFTRSEQAVDAALFRNRIENAALARRALGLPDGDTTVYRLVHGEGDGLPGLIVDVLGDVVVVQLNTIGVKRREGVIFSALEELLSPRAIIDRTSEAAAKIEGVPAGAGVVRGDSALTELAFRERGFDLHVPMGLGQKTGYYADQRSLRARVETLARGRTVLDAYSFIGAFSLAAARGGASRVLAVDQSALAAEIAAENARRNGWSDVISVERGDALKVMERVGAEGGFELVLCDPPKLAVSRAKLDTALTGYRKIARVACRATHKRGLLVFSSCSGAVGFDELTRALALGARDAGLQATVLEHHIQAPDHPVPAAFPEGLYLKSLIAMIEPIR